MKHLVQPNLILQYLFDQKGIEGLDLVELDVWNNSKITNVSFMKNLKKLDASGSGCGIDQKGIEGLDLVELNVWNNIFF